MRVRVDGERFEATLTDGEAVVPIGLQDQGRHTIRVTYEGSDQVAPARGSATIHVRR